MIMEIRVKFIGDDADQAKEAWIDWFGYVNDIDVFCITTFRLYCKSKGWDFDIKEIKIIGNMIYIKT